MLLIFQTCNLAAQLNKLLIVLLSRFETFQLLFRPADTFGGLLIFSRRAVMVFSEKFPILCQDTLFFVQLLFPAQQLFLFRIQPFDLPLGPNPVQLKGLLAQIIRTDPVKPQEITVHGHRYPSLPGDGIFKIAYL